MVDYAGVSNVLEMKISVRSINSNKREITTVGESEEPSKEIVTRTPEQTTTLATSKESQAFINYLQRSGLLLKNHKILSLNPGPAFQIMKHACKDGDDLYILSFDSGISLKTPKDESLTLSYPSGTGGSWTPIFKHDPQSGYFQFLGANVHKWAFKIIETSGKVCPDIEVAVHGSLCNKEGAAACSALLKYNMEKGYELDFFKN